MEANAIEITRHKENGKTILTIKLIMAQDDGEDISMEFEVSMGMLNAFLKKKGLRLVKVKVV